MFSETELTQSNKETPELESAKKGRKAFYDFFCGQDPSHNSISFFNKKLCKQCTEEQKKNVYMKKKCKHCKEVLNYSQNHECKEYEK